MIKEYTRSTISGFLALPVILVLMGLFVWMLVAAGQIGNIPMVLGYAFVLLVLFVCLFGHFMVHPNEAKVTQLFGKYSGTVHVTGLRWANPFLTKKAVSRRVRNFDSDRLKVNDSNGSPIEIAAVVVWRVVDTAEAVFEVDDYEDFVQIQSEAALRGLASRYAYDHGDDNGDDEESLSLRGNSTEVADQLRTDVQDRLNNAGVEVIEARISHLAYAPEIASAMLQRQQAGAIIAARRKIVEGAVGMVEMALDQLNAKQVVELDEERKAAMVSNLLVVLCGDRSTQPIVNTGTLNN